MADKYANFAALQAGEPAGAFVISIRDTGTAFIVVAPHGGGIEPGTSEIALAIAGSTHSYYLFDGAKPQGNRALHITSSNFDEPAGLAVMRRSEVVLTVHGEDSEDEIVYVGGRNALLKTAVRALLESFGYVVREHENPRLQGLHPQNICNAGRSGAGLQLELSAGLRASFFESLTRRGRKKPTDRLSEFSKLASEALGKYALQRFRRKTPNVDRYDIDRSA